LPEQGALISPHATGRQRRMADKPQFKKIRQQIENNPAHEKAFYRLDRFDVRAGRGSHHGFFK